MSDGVAARLAHLSAAMSAQSKAAWQALAATGQPVQAQALLAEAVYLEDVALLEQWLATHPAVAVDVDLHSSGALPAGLVLMAVGALGAPVTSLRDARIPRVVREALPRLPADKQMSVRERFSRVKAAGLGCEPDRERSLLFTVIELMAFPALYGAH